MEQVLYFIALGALFFFMMRMCCGPMAHGHGKGGHEGHGQGGEAGKQGLGPFDPVCGMDVSDRTPVTSLFEGKTYYFCSQTCKDTFEKEPGKYAAGTGGHRHGGGGCC